MSNAEESSVSVSSNGCSCPDSQYIFNASAYGFAAELRQPVRHSIETQAASVLAADGGHSHARVRDFRFNSFISVADAHTEVGGRYDECHNIHTSYAYSALEKVNVADVLTADRIVSRLYVYSYADDTDTSFSITGSHFENLKIAGHKVEVQWPTSAFNGYETFSGAAGAGAWMVGSELAKLKADALEGLEETYHALKGMTGLIEGWKKPSQNRSTYLLSPANQLTLEGHKNADPKKKNNGGPDWVNSGIQQFGNVICVPKFGVIRLAELVVHKHCRSLTMFRVQMCSGADGSAGGGGTVGGGGRP
jgi:hypothetical protein